MKRLGARVFGVERSRPPAQEVDRARENEVGARGDGVGGKKLVDTVVRLGFGPRVDLAAGALGIAREVDGGEAGAVLVAGEREEGGLVVLSRASPEAVGDRDQRPVLAIGERGVRRSFSSECASLPRRRADRSSSSVAPRAPALVIASADRKE